MVSLEHFSSQYWQAQVQCTNFVLLIKIRKVNYNC